MVFAATAVTFLVAAAASLFAKAVEVVGKYVRKKFAVRIVFVGVVVVLLGTLIGVLEGLFAGLSIVMPSGMSNLLVMVLPSNTSYCIGSCITATIARRMYEYNLELAKHTWLGI